jgi:hypothetical protein
MARISSYPRDLEVTDGDAWVGTESSNRLTRNFTAAAVAKYLNIKGKISISAQMVFKFTQTNPPANGQFSGPANDSNIAAITTMQISNVDASGQNTVAFMEYLVGNNILISEQNNISLFGHFTIDSYTLNNNVATLNLTNIFGNGTLDLDKHYDFAVFTLSSRGSSTEIIPFNNVAVVTANHTGNLGTNPSVTVVNPNNLVIQGEVSYITNKQLTITFTSPQTGNVYLN